MALAQIRNGEIIKRFAAEKGWFQLEDGRWASPPVAGFTSGNDKIVPVVEETNDTSTTDAKASSQTQTVEAERVLIVRTIRDRTAEEIETEKDVLILSEADQVLGKVIFQLVNDVRQLRSQQPVTKAQFLTYLKGLL